MLAHSSRLFVYLYTPAATVGKITYVQRQALMRQNLSNKFPRSTLRGQLVNQILAGIFRGELRGDDRLIEEELAVKFGVSRTPIREAFGELAAIGVIQLKPNHGAIVRPFG